MSSEIKIIGVSGGSGSGKSYLVDKLKKVFDEAELSVIHEDSYYRNLDHIPFEERTKHNFDHPHSKDFILLANHLASLKAGNKISVPVYDFKNHIRSQNTLEVQPTDIILVEGILLFESEKIRELLDLMIYVDTPDDIRLVRRIERDINERGRSIESVLKQYMTTVRPMHEKYIKPHKDDADIVIAGDGYDASQIELIKLKIYSLYN